MRKLTHKQRQAAAVASRDEPDGIWRCRYCRVELARSDVWPLDWHKPHPELDHVVPRSQGGSEAISNIVLSCQGCNVRKGAYLIDELPAGWSEWRTAGAY